jgi:transposase
MNGATYQKVLEDHLIPFMSIHRATHFLHNGTSCHASKRIKEYLADKPFTIIDWQGNSPDLSPIENCWKYMKEKLKSKDTRSIEKLKREIKILWTNGLFQGVFEEPERFYAQKDLAGAGCEGGQHWLLINLFFTWNYTPI